MSHLDIQMRLYKSVLLVGVLVSSTSIIANFALGYTSWTNLKWAILLLNSAIAFFLSKNEKIKPRIMFIFFTYIIYGFMPLAIIGSGGGRGYSLGYVFFVMIIIAYLFNSWKRIFLIISLDCVFISTIILCYIKPEIMTTYPEETLFIPRIIQLAFFLFISFHVMLKFSKEYERVNNVLSKMADHDELTGLFNKRVFNEAIEKAFEEKKEAYLAFFDINYFKKVNDNCGHYMGDCVLKGLAEILINTFNPKQHVVCRWGGDEFAVIFYGGKDELIEKLGLVSDQFIPYISQYEKSSGISTSFVCLSDYDSISQILDIADKQLYKQKHDILN